VPHAAGLTVLYLHGVHQQRLIERPLFTQHFAAAGLFVVAPSGGRSWWSARLCEEWDPRRSAEQYLLEDVLPFLDRELGATPPRIALLGTSMGGQGALRLAFKYPQRFAAVAAISPAIDYHLRYREGDEVLFGMYRDEEDCRQDTATLHVHPLNWPRHIWFCCDPADERWHDSSARLRSKLYSLGIAHQCDLQSTAGGHGWPYYEHMAPAAVDFLTRSLAG